MTPEFKFSVVSTNVDGGESTSKFINARSALMWAKRLQEEGIKFSIYTLTFKGGYNWDTKELSLKDLKTRAGSEKQPQKRKRR